MSKPTVLRSTFVQNLEPSNPTLSLANDAHSMLLACVRWRPAGGSLPSIASAGNTFDLIYSDSTKGFWLCLDAVANSSVEFTYNASYFPYNADAYLLEISGATSATAVPAHDTSAVASATNGSYTLTFPLFVNTPTTWAMALVVFTGTSGDLVIGAIFSDNGFGSTPPAGGWSDLFPTSGHSWSVVLELTGTTPSAVCIPVGDIVLDICKRAGIDTSLVDVTLLTAENLKPTNLCCGYVITRPTPAAQILQVLTQAFFFDIVESDGILKCVPRGLPSVDTIPEEDLGMEEDKTKIVETIGQEQDLPFRVTTLYNDENADYQQGKQEATRNSRIVSTRNQEIMTMPLTMNADFGRQVAEKALFLRWLERNGYSTNLWRPKYMRYDPTDVLQFVYEGLTFQIRVVDASIGQGFVVAINGVGDNARNYLSSAQGGSATTGGGQPPTNIAPPTLLFLFDIPLLRDVDSNSVGTGYYYAMSSGANNWTGGVLFTSFDNTSFTFEDSDGEAVSFGYTTNVLPPPRSPWTWDYVNTLNVMMVNGTLDSDTELNVLNGSRAIIANGEVIQWVNSTLEMDGSYTLSKLLRGRRGTELQCGSHAAGELVVDLNSGMKRIADPLSLLNQLRYYRGVTSGQDPSLATSQDFTITGNDLRPYAPVHIKGTRDAGGNLTLDWIRRTRIGGAWLDNTETVPLSETSELYDVDILSGSTVVRTLANLPAPTASYPATLQGIDFGALQAALSVKVYQRSSVVGRGFAGAATV